MCHHPLLDPPPSWIGAVGGQHVGAQGADMGIGDVEVEIEAVGSVVGLQGQPVGIAQAAAVERLGVAAEEDLLGAAIGACWWRDGG